jgi:phosphoribosylformimino-5-aminoimidazole carboxamide ribonucleotide (ProFAR) isomerase
MAKKVTESEKAVPNGTDIGDQLAAGIREQAKAEGLTQGDVEAVPNGTLFTDDPEAFEEYLSKAGMDAMAEQEAGYEKPTASNSPRCSTGT